MPRIPEKATLNATSPEILNVIRNENSELRAMLPKADGSTENLRAIGEIIMTYQPLQNAFLSALVNRIGRVLITSRLYENPWAGFKKGMLEYGETVEEIFVELAKPHQFDPELAETNQFKREIPDVRAAFHTMNYQKFYKTTVSNDQLRQAFLSYQGITDLIGRIIDALYTGANFDEFIVMKYLIARVALDGNIHPINIPDVTKENASGIVSNIKGVSNMLEFMSSDYNYAHVHTYTDKRFQYLIMNAEFNAVIDVEVLAQAFNMSKAEFMGNNILVNSFVPTADEQERLAMLFANDPTYVPFTQDELNLLKTVPAVLIDEQWFMIFDNYMNMTEKYNGEGLYWNYWYHVWKTFSVSPFNNAVLFSTTTPAITSVAITPATASAQKGQSVQLTSVVTGAGFNNKQVNWTINSELSTVSNTGLVVIGAEETATSLTVTATSVEDSTKSGTSTITVIA